MNAAGDRTPLRPAACVTRARSPLWFSSAHSYSERRRGRARPRPGQREADPRRACVANGRGGGRRRQSAGWHSAARDRRPLRLPSPAARPARPAVGLTASAAHVSFAGRVRLRWSSSNARSCRATGSWGGNRGTHGSLVTPSLRVASTYRLTCTGPGGAASARVKLAVGAPTAVSRSGRSARRQRHADLVLHERHILHGERGPGPGRRARMARS